MFIMSNTPKEQLKNATDTNHKSTDNSSNSNSTKNTDDTNSTKNTHDNKDDKSQSDNKNSTSMLIDDKNNKDTEFNNINVNDIFFIII